MRGPFRVYIPLSKNIKVKKNHETIPLKGSNEAYGGKGKQEEVGERGKEQSAYHDEALTVYRQCQC